MKYEILAPMRAALSSNLDIVRYLRGDTRIFTVTNEHSTVPASTKRQPYHHFHRRQQRFVIVSPYSLLLMFEDDSSVELGDIRFPEEALATSVTFRNTPDLLSRPK